MVSMGDQHGPERGKNRRSLDVAESRALDTEARLSVMEDLLANISRQYRAEVNKYGMIPQNVTVSIRHGSEMSTRPRVTLVDCHHV
ncbi:hypothetical protein LX32DRAFT_229031 [Colletotrichum zoysiae]|uniref:Uncharacterized protein n=1 Tax=Colletotrichum zoysiae TaxID=1216348 RepID=A0AAD9H3N7_9PEZI|nr:hypothetical protein LX32DRAFT_229031 [Colletotrichum zoysiae]